MTWRNLKRPVLATFCVAGLGLAAMPAQAGASIAAVSARVVTGVQTAESDTTAGTPEEAAPTETSNRSPAVSDPPADPIGRMASGAPRDTSVLAAAIEQLISSSGANVGVTLVELDGSSPINLSVNGLAVITAASTYKLAALMLEAENVATGKTDPNGSVCFQPDDYETGWFDDYGDGVCLSRNELALRAGRYSDNTAGHMLVRDIGGEAVLNDWAASHGTTKSAFFVGNTTTSVDLAVLWMAEAQGKMGGSAAQAWLYPFLTDTRTESGIPAGIATGTVVHKTGTVDAVDNDAALVTGGPDGAYILTVMTDGLGGADGWQLIANISSAVAQFEASRTNT